MNYNLNMREINGVKYYNFIIWQIETSNYCEFEYDENIVTWKESAGIGWAAFAGPKPSSSDLGNGIHTNHTNHTIHTEGFVAAMRKSQIFGKIPEKAAQLLRKLR